ncbi:MAG: preprotein translocase subunit SecE [Candidatus Limiplasma sp.]|nr:preprotein translocase subunit SecE [Candidatus Limiplasma sp.]MEA5146640.1 preprotein translocase subunit SecE [Candidatus Limiplasma sp.]
MADEKKAVAKGKKANFFVRFGRGFVNFFKKIGLSFKNMWHELQKVTWPTKDKLVNYVIIVLLMIAFLMLIIGLLDMGASALVNLLISK